MKNRYFTISLLMTVLILLMYLSVSVVLADGGQPSSINIGNYVITDTNGERIERLIPGGGVKAKVTVETGEEREVSLVMVLYCGNEMIDARVARKVVNGSDAVEVVFPSLPASTQGCFVKVFMWDNVYNMTRIGRSVIFPSNNAELSVVSIAGTTVDLNSVSGNVYNMQVSPYTVYGFPVSVQTKDAAAQYTIEYPESLPGDLIINVEASDGNQKEYTFHCTRAVPAINNLLAKTGSKLAIDNDMAVGDLLYTDRTFKIVEMSDGFAGMTHILTANNDKNSSVAKEPNGEGFITFDLPMSADIYTCGYAAGNWLNSFTKQTGLRLRRDDGTSFVDYDNSIYKKHIDVIPGESVCVSLGTPGTASIGQIYVVLIKWTYPQYK